MKTEFTITKEQIKHIQTAAMNNYVIDDYLQTWFPEAFKNNPMPGKWYVGTNKDGTSAIIFFQKKNTESRLATALIFMKFGQKVIIGRLSKPQICGERQPPKK